MDNTFDLEFRKYPHLERFGTTEVEQIELGHCYIFPKIDGTNASVWIDKKAKVRAGSRNRELSLENDNAEFYNEISKDDSVTRFLVENPFLRLYGEWLVPHSLKTYRDDAWRKFYVFDVFDEETKEFLPFDEYNNLLSPYGISVIQPLAIINNPSFDQLLAQSNKNTYLVKDGEGVGEGIVIKNYNFKNKYGRVTWAKLVTNSFKEKHIKAMGPSILEGKSMLEEEIVDKYVDSHLVEKTFEKIKLENGGFSSRMIPQLLNTVYYDLVREECWNFVKEHKNPSINFKTLMTLTYKKVKEIKAELF